MAPTMEQEILQQEEQLAEAKRPLDLGTIDRMYADDLVLTGVGRTEEGARRWIHHAVCIADPAGADDAASRRPPPRDDVTFG